jgi:hypothetical protein
MESAVAAFGAAIGESDKLRVLLRRRRDPQVRGTDERALAKATALTWFNKHRAAAAAFADGAAVARVDQLYRTILEAGDRASSRIKLLATIKQVRAGLIGLRSGVVASPQSGRTTSDDAPDFSPLITDAPMQSILVGRWRECVSCLAAEAPLAATVMMGGFLEALLLARINRETNKSALFKSAVAPRDKSGHARPLSEWTLKNYIDIVHAQGWISVSAKDVGEVLRDYRNYIHPFKQLSHNIQLETADAALFWEITKSVSRQLIGTAP